MVASDGGPPRTHRQNIFPAHRSRPARGEEVTMTPIEADQQAARRRSATSGGTGGIPASGCRATEQGTDKESNIIQAIAGRRPI